VATMYQLGLLRQAGSVTAPSSARTPHGTWESAVNAACRADRSAAKEAGNFSRSWNCDQMACEGFSLDSSKS
jgi:hypothetical protein